MDSTPTADFKVQNTTTRVSLDDGLEVVRLKLDVLGNFKTNMEKQIIIALDKSGSMSGGAMTMAQEAVKEMIEYLHHSANRNITLIPYNNKAHVHFLQAKTDEEIKNLVNGIKAESTTNFVEAFKFIKTAIKEQKSKNVSVIFFTDGQDTCNKPKPLQSELNLFSQFIKKETEYSETHTIGFTSDHDAKLLNTITKIGKNQGTFQYCRQSADIKKSVDSIAGLIGGLNITASIHFPAQDEVVNIDLEETYFDNSKREMQALAYIQQDWLSENQELKLVVGVGNFVTEQIIKVSDIQEDESARVQIESLRLGYIKSNIENLIKEVTLISTDTKDKKSNDALNIKLKDLTEQVEVEQERINEFMGSVGKRLKTSQRKDIFPLIQEIREMVTEFYSILKVMQFGQIDNDVIASLNALAYRNITKKGLQKKLDQRTQNNVNLINDVYSKITNIVSKLDGEELQKKYADLSEQIGTCVLSCSNFVEALMDEDCMCLTFNIGRSQATIADPTQAVIKDIYPSFLTAGSFLYSANFAVKKDSKAHGGFERNAEGLIVKGAAQEHITGVMPLFISPEHWKVAKLLMKPTLGWSCTLDPLGYAYSQVKTIPFMVLAKMAQMIYEHPDNSFYKQQFQLVKDTCVQIMKDGSQDHFDTKFSEEIGNLWTRYIGEPTARTADQIPHNPVFLAQVYCGIEAGLIEKKSKEEFFEFFKRVMEEELRRKQYPLPENHDVKDWMFKLLNINTKKYIDDPMDAFFKMQNQVDIDVQMQKQMQNASIMEQKFLDAKIQYDLVVKKDQYSNSNMEEKKKGDEEESKKNKKDNDPRSKEQIIYEYELRINGTYNIIQGQALQEYTQLLGRIGNYMEGVRRLFDDEDIGSPKKFNTWEIKSDTQFFAIYIQNKLQNKNAARREAISKRNYKDPWNEDQEFIQFWYGKLIEEEKARRLTQFTTEQKKQESSGDASAFAYGKTLEEAGGALLGAMVGVNVMAFFRALIKKPIDDLFKEKLKMLTTGHLMGVKLFQDAEEWHPKRRHANKMYKAHTKALTPEEWVEIFPSMSYTFAKGEGKCPPPDKRAYHKLMKKERKRKQNEMKILKPQMIKK